MMDWRGFCDLVEEVFQVKGLEKVNPSEETKKVDLIYNYGRSESNNN